MNIPNTPRTIISQLVNPEKAMCWNGAWRRFFDIYHAPISIMVTKEFHKHGWYDLPLHVVDEVISDVVISLNSYFTSGKYNPAKGKFRFLLKKMAMCRAMDYMRKNYKYLTTESIDIDDYIETKFEEIVDSDAHLELDRDEIIAFRYSMILDAYESIRHNFSPRTCLAFEMIKLEQAKIEDVVKELGVSPNTVNNAVYRIMKKLKEVVYDDGEREILHES